MNEKFDGSQTGRYSRYERDNYVSFKIAMIVIALMAVFAALVLTGTLKVHAASYLQGETHAGMFGDCMADYATGDIYLTSDDYCGTLPSNGDTRKVKHSDDVPDTTIVPTTETTPEPPVITPPADFPPTEPEDNACKNKNSGKDGTPSECNAGKGQEKHN